MDLLVATMVGTVGLNKKSSLEMEKEIEFVNT